MTLVVLYITGALVDGAARLARWAGRALVVAVVVVALALLDGCATLGSAGPLWTEQFFRADVPALPEAEGEAQVPLVAGDPAPFTGVLLDLPDHDYYLAADDQRRAVIDALDLSYRGRQADRDEAEAILAAREVQLGIARQNQLRAFAGGTGVGGVLVAALVLAVVLGTR